MIPEEIKESLTNSFVVRVCPNKNKTTFVSIMSDNSLKIDLTSPPEGGKANKELIKYLSEELEIKKDNMEIASGKSSRTKHIKISN